MDGRAWKPDPTMVKTNRDTVWGNPYKGGEFIMRDIAIVPYKGKCGGHGRRNDIAVYV